MKTFIRALAFLCAITCFAAEVPVPAKNQGAWIVGTETGVPGGFKQYLAGEANDRAVTGTLVDITQAPYNADNTGVADTRDIIQQAINDAVGPTVIYFPAGSYKIASGFIYIGSGKDELTLRGAGETTVFHPSALNNPIFVWNSPGSFDTDVQTITGTKTKGTTVLTVASSTGYAAGTIAAIRYENEVDVARITAGANPVWTSGGWPKMRTMLVRVVETTPTTITIEAPGLPADGTNLALEIGRYPFNNISSYCGFEDFAVSFDQSNHPTQFFNVTAAEYTWFHNIRFLNFARTSYNGSCIKISETYRCEIRFSRFDADTTVVDGGGNSIVSSDGAIETGLNTGLVTIDNIFTGPFGEMIYESGNSNNTVIAYNFNNAGTLSHFHNAHPSLNLVEGNAGRTHFSDGYHGSSSNNTITGNYYYESFSVVLNRFKREYWLANNIFGTDGSASYALSFGNPNMGNGSAQGFAGPTGTSTAVGQIDYYQYGYGVDEYIIQSSDISVGDFWQDWEVTGTLTTRTSDTVGVFTVSGGNWYVGNSVTGGSRLYPIFHWNNKVGRITSGEVTNVAGNLVTISFPAGTLPAEGTAGQLYFFAAGWQERDLDVEATTTQLHNYRALAGGTGSVHNSTTDTFPASRSHSAKPEWFGNLPWPPYEASSPVFDVTRIPAGYRYTNNNTDYLGGVSTPQFSPSPGTHASGTELTITSSTPAATIYYTIDGSTPTTSSTLYTGPISLPDGVTEVKAIAVKAEMTDSSVQSGTYTISGGETGVVNLNINGNLIIQKLIIQ